MRDTIRKSANRYGRKPTDHVARIANATARMAAIRLQASEALRINRCPQCGSTVRQNLSLTGWVQCAQFGAPSFRLDSTKPACDWQGFTS